MPVRKSPAVRAACLKDLQEGHSYKDIASRQGVSPSYVKQLNAKRPPNERVWRNKSKALIGPVAYEDLIPEAQRGWNDLAYFARRYFGVILMPWHLETALQIAAMVETDQKEYLVVNCPPGAGKSTLMTRILPAWLTVRNRAIRGMIVSNTQRNAENYTDLLRRAFEHPLPIRADDNDLRLGIAVDAESSLPRDYGIFKAPNADSGQVWSRKAVQVMQWDDRPVSQKEPTWSAFGMGGQFLGNRLNVILGDDVYDKSAQQTPEARQKFKLWFDANVETRLEPNGLLALVGQRQHADDIYRYVLDKRDSLDDDGEEIPDENEHARMYQHVMYKAHYDSLCTGDHSRTALPYPDGCLIYPGRLKWRDLRKVQINAPDIWAVEYQQEDSDIADALVRPEWVYGGTDPYTKIEYPGCLDRDRDEWQIPEGLGRLFMYATCDPSPTNYWSIQLYGYHEETDQRFLIAHHRSRMRANDLLDYKINDGKYSGLMEDWQVRSKEIGRPIQYWIVEDNAAQKFLMQYDWAKKWQSLRGCLVQAHNTNQHNKSDPKLGVQAMASIWRQGKIRLPGYGLGRIQSEKLIQEMLVWPAGGTDDCVMAAWFGEWNLPRLFFPHLDKPYQRNVPSWLPPARDRRHLTPVPMTLRSAG